MTLKDASLLGRKILLGIIISIIPLVITVGGLTLIRKVFTYHDAKTSTNIANPQNSKK